MKILPLNPPPSGFFVREGRCMNRLEAYGSPWPFLGLIVERDRSRHGINTAAIRTEYLAPEQQLVELKKTATGEFYFRPGCQVFRGAEKSRHAIPLRGRSFSGLEQ